mmetsp:Transcript_102712/g.257510  ORF Transcript_102712/g.257510 Transcript_102712/m.257510 type:complete len:84 (+) Transcript_102712:222-473(+)
MHLSRRSNVEAKKTSSSCALSPNHPDTAATSSEIEEQAAASNFQLRPEDTAGFAAEVTPPLEDAGSRLAAARSSVTWCLYTCP